MQKYMVGDFLIGRNQIGDDVDLMPGDRVALIAVSLLLWSHREEKGKRNFSFPTLSPVEMR